MSETPKLLSKHGGYRKLKSFQVAQLVYDVTIRFCDRYVSNRSRTHDQMVQAQTNNYISKKFYRRRWLYRTSL